MKHRKYSLAVCLVLFASGVLALAVTAPQTQNSGAQAVQVVAALPTGANTIGNVGITGTPNFNLNNAIPAGTNIIGKVGIDPANNGVTLASGAKVQVVPVNACGATNFELAWTAIPTSSTVMSSTNMCLESMTIQCPAGVSVTITDNAGSPVALLPAAFNFPSAAFARFEYDLRQTNGVKASATSTGCLIALKGVQSP